MKRIMIIEDETALRDELSVLLQNAGYEPIAVTDYDSVSEQMKSANADLILLDIKHIDDEKHKVLTGHTNKNILDCARWLSDIGKPVWIRHVLVPGINDSEEDLSRTAEFISTLKNVKKVEILPYHTLGIYKWEELGYHYTLKDVKPPTDERVAMAKRILSA